MMKTCSRDLLQQMTETYKTRIAGTDDFRSTLDALFFTALRAARESDTLRQFDCFKEAERYLLRIAELSERVDGRYGRGREELRRGEILRRADSSRKGRTAFGLSAVRIEIRTGRAPAARERGSLFSINRFESVLTGGAGRHNRPLFVCRSACRKYIRRLS